MGAALQREAETVEPAPDATEFQDCVLHVQIDWRDSSLPQPALPEAIVHVSAVEGTGIAPLREALQSLLRWASL